MDLKKLSKVQDNLVYTGKLTVGNSNDFANLINRVCPNANGLTVKVIEEVLYDEYDAGTVLSYLYTQKRDSSISDVEIVLPTGWLYFK